MRLDVCDTGEGIAPEELAHIWERFYRGEDARAQDQEGTGLGLALVKELTEAMGGKVGVRSVVGEGSCFGGDVLLGLVRKVQECCWEQVFSARCEGSSTVPSVTGFEWLSS